MSAWQTGRNPTDVFFGEPLARHSVLSVVDLSVTALCTGRHSDDVIFAVFADRNGIRTEDQAAARDQFFSKGQPCLRTSPLAKSYGWGIHADADGRVALVPMRSSRYDALMTDDATVKRAAMKTSR